MIHPLPPRPRTFLWVYWVLALSALAPGFFLNSASPGLALRMLWVGVNLGFLASGAWQLFWMWRTLQFVGDRAPGDAPDRVRAVRRIAMVSAPVWLASIGLSFVSGPISGVPSADLEIRGVDVMLSVLTFASIVAALWITVRAICEAERAADVPGRSGGFTTVLQIVYLPFVAVMLYRRLEALTLKAPAAIEATV